MSEAIGKTTIYDKLINIFKENKYQIDVNNDVFIEKVIDDVVHQGDEIIKLLLGDATLKKTFFKQVEEAMIFDAKALIEVLSAENKYLESRTTYSQSIGLTKKDDFIKTNDDVVLSFPFKDTVFVGGQEKEDEKTNENFLQEIINSNDIARLFEPKVMTSIKRYSKDKVEENPTITENDNLIIKGNNLLALHSLLDRADGEALYRGKVKLIYIDPPYNTGNDSFNYNDNFSHSTWLTFMKNRLEVAREFLSDDGLMFLHIDDTEQAYVKILMDEIFERGNHVSTIAVRSSTASGMKTTHREKTIIKQKDFILVYKKTNNITLRPQYIKKDKWDTHYSYFLDKEKLKVIKLKDILVEKGILLKSDSLNELNINNKKFSNFYKKYKDNIFQTAPELPTEVKKISKAKRDKVIEYGEGKNINYALNGRRLTFLSKTLKPVYHNQVIENDIATLLCDFWEDIDFQNTQNKGGVSFPSGKKPEFLLYRIIDMCTKPNDLIMDYHLGSGTTCAVAHKMGRRYIGIEQMDYIEDIAVERMKKVIEGEEGGISKAVKWQGGGNFVYMELKELEEYKGTELAQDMRYLPIEEIEDETYNISKEEQESNFAFYGIDTKRD